MTVGGGNKGIRSKVQTKEPKFPLLKLVPLCEKITKDKNQTIEMLNQIFKLQIRQKYLDK